MAEMTIDLESPEVRAALEEEIGAQPHPLLFATISGAHLYGFPSADSDIDIRGVHVLPLREVIGLGQNRDTIEAQATRAGILLETVTHDVKKFALLLLKRNGYVLEQLFSPLIVRTSPEHSELKQIARACITRDHYLHYLGFADNQLKLLQKKPAVKQVLYIYRVLLTGIHLMRTGEVEANLQRLVAVAALPHVLELVERKVGGSELLALRPDELPFHERQYANLAARLREEAAASALPESHSAKDALSDFVVRVRMSLDESR